MPAVFDEDLGTVSLRAHKAKLSVTKEAKTRFYRPRPMPYALKPRVEEELNRLEQAGVITKVDYMYSEWAAPIVTVPKSDGQLGIRGKYSVTINPVLDVDQYLLPRPEDLFATLSGGKTFSTLDLKHAYNQIEIHLVTRGCLSEWRPTQLFFKRRWTLSCKDWKVLFVMLTIC